VGIVALLCDFRFDLPQSKSSPAQLKAPCENFHFKNLLDENRRRWHARATTWGMSAKKFSPLPRSIRKLVTRALAGVIRRRRERLKLSICQLAKLAGISRQMLGYVEDDQRKLSIVSLELVAAPLGLTGSELLHAAELWLKRRPVCCKKCHNCCLRRGKLVWLNRLRGCTRPAR
jgi:DNA-binding transcriptional regulator YiaG